MRPKSTDCRAGDSGKGAAHTALRGELRAEATHLQPIFQAKSAALQNNFKQMHSVDFFFK